MDGHLTEAQKTQQILNSTKVNEALINHVEAMFELEFILKQKAQLKYLQVKSGKSVSKIFPLFSVFSHEYLWSPTPVYYMTSLLIYVLTKKRFRMTSVQFLPFLALPPTFDYIKRDHYTSKFPDEKGQLTKTTAVVNSILEEKRQQVTTEHMMRFFFHL